MASFGWESELPSTSLLNQARLLLDCCRGNQIMLATAESCTGGLIAGTLTEIAGSSDVVACGYVTYTNDAKMRMLAVPEAMLEQFGAVSEPVARAMAEAAVALSEADLAVAVTGVAGPGGGSAEKPVGLVHLATARVGGDIRHRRMEYGDIGRGPVRQATIETAFEMLLGEAVDW